MKLIIVRHGETHANAMHIVQGQQDTLLNDSGEQQARDLGKILRSKERIDAVYTSPLQRASRTAELLCDEGVPVHECSELKERFMGPIEGMRHSVARAKRIEDGLPSLLSYGENQFRFRERVLRGYKFVIKDSQERGYETVVAVTHGGVLNQLLPKLYNTGMVGFADQEVYQRYRKRPKYGNCCVTIVNDEKFEVFAEQWTKSIERERDLL